MSAKAAAHSHDLADGRDRSGRVIRPLSRWIILRSPAAHGDIEARHKGRVESGASIEDDGTAA
jgi:hypothetical protein